MEWVFQAAKPLDVAAEVRARGRQVELTKPPGSLGLLETLAVRLCGMQGMDQPSLENVQITVFAADHGVAEAGVSAFPQEVTSQMVANFAHGGAAISVLARQLDAVLEVVDVGAKVESTGLPKVIQRRIAAGTQNFQYSDAMDTSQLAEALLAGREAVERAIDQNMQLFVGGDMGIANTTAAAALGSALLAVDPTEIVGPGTGLDDQGVAHKAAVIREALSRYPGIIDEPLEVLRCLGGFEIAALTGAYLACAQHGLPILIDGYITTAAALVASRLQPALLDWCLFSHRSAEPGHRLMLERLSAQPLLDLGMRLGEGSGAATAVPLLRLACSLHNDMATFADAGVAKG